MVCSCNLVYQKDTYVFTSPVERSSMRKVVAGLKYLVYDPYKKEKKPNMYSWKANNSFQWNSLIPAVSLYAGMNINFFDNAFLIKQDPLFDPKVVLITQNQFSNAQVFTTNFYMDKIMNDDKTYGYVLTYTKGFGDKWSIFLENKGFKSNAYSDLIGTCGIAYLVNSDLQVDINISKSWKDTPSLLYGGAGVSWRFDGNFQFDKIEKKKAKKTKNKNSVKPQEKKVAPETKK
jgi:Putative MetA-pathway of phenol degradation